MENCWSIFLDISSGSRGAAPIDEILELLSKLDSSKRYLEQYLDRCVLDERRAYTLSFREKQAQKRQERRNQLIEGEILRLEEIHSRVQESLANKQLYDVLCETRDVLRKTLQTIQIDKIESLLVTTTEYDFNSISGYGEEEAINVEVESLVFPACPQSRLPAVRHATAV